MTDSELDIDPTLDAHLRRTLREVAATIGAGAPADRNVVRLVPAAPPPKPRHWRWIAAAAVAGVASGAALLVVANRDSDPNASLVTSTVPGEVEADVVACNRQVDQARRSGPSFDATPGGSWIPNVNDSEVRVFPASPGRRSVLVVDDDAFALCGFSSGLPQGMGYGPLPVAPPGTAEVTVVDSPWGSESGAIWIEVLGRSGAAVADVGLEIGDGTIAGTVVDGWFYIYASNVADISMADALEVAVLRWTTVKGTEHSVPLDLFDGPAPGDLCAENADCLQVRATASRGRPAGAVLG